MSEKKGATRQSFIRKEITTYRIGTLGRVAIMAVRVIKVPKKGYKIRSIFAQSTLFSKLKANF